MHYVYVLRSEKDGHRYVGIAKDLKQRFGEHQKGKVPATRSRRPFVLMYYEAHPGIKSARMREVYLKSGWGRTYLTKVERMTFEAKN